MAVSASALPLRHQLHQGQDEEPVSHRRRAGGRRKLELVNSNEAEGKQYIARKAIPIARILSLA